MKAFEPAELVAVLEHCPDEWLLFFEFLSETALRIGEAIEVHWSDVDRGSRWMTVSRKWYRGKIDKPKGRKTRRVRFSATLDARFGSTASRAAAATTISCSRAGRAPGSTRATSPPASSARPARRPGGGDWATWHTFRHPCGSQLFRCGWNAAQVSRFLGHGDAGFTLRTYVHLLDDDQPESTVLESLGRGNSGATQATETGRNGRETGSALIALPVRDRPASPNLADVPVRIMSGLL